MWFKMDKQCEYGKIVILPNSKREVKCDNESSVIVSFEGENAPNKVYLCKWHSWLLTVHEEWDFEKIEGFNPNKYKD